MGQWYQRPSSRVRLEVEPRLASWDTAGHPSQVKLAEWLDHVECVAARTIDGIDGALAVELTVGVGEASPISGGRDLDNYLYPVMRRLGVRRIVAVFGRKVPGPTSWLAIGPTMLDTVEVVPLFTARLAGSYERTEWKRSLRDKLIAAGVGPAPAGPLRMRVAVTTGAGRNWANLIKPLLDSFGPVLGEDAVRPFHPNDDRIVDLGLHHHLDLGLGHDVIVEAWWDAAFR